MRCFAHFSEKRVYSGVLQENVIKLKKQGYIYKIEVDILIDRITNCLIDTRTGEEVEMDYRLRETPIRPKDYKGWKFNWSITGIVETSTHNYGYKGIYASVGAHLFAIACQISLDAGCDGVVAFTSKSDLVGYYMDKLNAVEIMPRRMVIFEDAAQILLDKYIRK